jgi:hypothetical protein
VMFKAVHRLFSTLAVLTSLTRLLVEVPDAADLQQDPEWYPATTCDPRLEQDWPRAMTPFTALTGLRALTIGNARECNDSVSKACLQIVSCFMQLQVLTLPGDYDLNCNEAGGKVVTGADLWQLLPLQSTLPHLDRSVVNGVDGPGLAVIGKLTCLRALQLSGVSALKPADVAKHLLPLPPNVCDVHLDQGEPWSALEQPSAALWLPPGGLPGCNVHAYH